MKQKKRIISYMGFLTVMLFCILFVKKQKGFAAEAQPTFIYATYEGDSIAVGDRVNTDLVTVTAVYSDGTMEEVYDYEMSNDIISSTGINEITIIYRNKTTMLTVYGKKAIAIYPVYEGGAVSVGNSVDKRKITLTVTYQDGSSSVAKEFEIQDAEAVSAGIKTVIVEAYGLKASFPIVCSEPKTAKSLFVSYLGEPTKEGHPIDVDNVFVMATYEDNTVESIVNYELSQTVIEQAGINSITVFFQDKTASFNVVGIARKIVDFTAKYKGGTMEVGEEVTKEDFEAKIIYEDRASEVIQEYIFVNRTIYQVGTNIIALKYDNFIVETEITGTAKKEMSFDEAVEYYVANDFEEARVVAEYMNELDTEELTIKTLDSSYVKRVLTRTVHDCEYISFSVEYGGEIEKRLPIQVRIYLPENYDIENTSIYFTPNLKSIIAEMTVERTAEGYITMPIFRNGSYIIAHSLVLPEAEADPEKNSSN